MHGTQNPNTKRTKETKGTTENWEDIGKLLDLRTWRYQGRARQTAIHEGSHKERIEAQKKELNTKRTKRTKGTTENSEDIGETARFADVALLRQSAANHNSQEGSHKERIERERKA